MWIRIFYIFTQIPCPSPWAFCQGTTKIQKIHATNLPSSPRQEVTCFRLWPCCCMLLPFFSIPEATFLAKKSLGKGRMVEETVCRLILNCELLQNNNMSNKPFQKSTWEIERLIPPKVVKRGTSPVWLTPDRRELLGILARMMWNNSVRVHQRITT